MVSERDEYKGNAMLVLMKDETDEFPFKFGIKKAKLILEHLEDIKQFVKDSEKQEVL